MVGPARMTAKETILQRVRAAIAPAQDYPAIPRSYRQSGPPELDLFEERLRDYGVRVYHCAPDAIRQAIADALSQAGKQSVLIPLGFPLDLLPSSVAFVRDNVLSYDDLDRSEGVLTLCAAAIAETGTIVLRHNQAEGRRALTLIPDYHLCVVLAEQVVATVPEGIRLAATFGNAPLTTIAGPSATSDIEMTRVKGVHGPRTLEVILAAARR